MLMHMCVFVCFCVCVCIIHTCVGVCVCACMHACTCVCKHVCVCVCSSKERAHPLQTARNAHIHASRAAATIFELAMWLHLGRRLRAVLLDCNQPLKLILKSFLCSTVVRRCGVAVD